MQVEKAAKYIHYRKESDDHLYLEMGKLLLGFRESDVSPCKTEYLWQRVTLDKVRQVGKVAKFRNRYDQVPHMTQVTIWQSDKNTIKHHTREPRGQQFLSR